MGMGADGRGRGRPMLDPGVYSEVPVTAPHHCWFFILVAISTPDIIFGYIQSGIWQVLYVDRVFNLRCI